MRLRPTSPATLAASSGFTVVSSDGAVGVVETPIFSGSSNVPDYLIARIGSPGRFRRVAIPIGLVEGADAETRAVTVAATSSAIAKLPGNLPIGRRS